MLKGEPFESRSALAKAIGEAGLTNCAEIGVYDGKFSEVICRNVPGVTMLCVDTWAPSRNHRNQRHLDLAYQNAVERMKGYNVSFLKLPSSEAAKQIEDGSLDFCYIDALHDFKSVYQDICSWIPKVKAGGVIAGHDWGHAGVTQAVKTYVTTHSIGNLRETVACPEDFYPSWYWEKSA